MTNTTDFYDILSTTRSIRRISDKPIDDEVLNRVLQAAIWAPSGGNRQPWRIIAVRDRAIKQQLSDIYAQRWSEYVDMNMKRVEGMPENIVVMRKSPSILATAHSDIHTICIRGAHTNQVTVLHEIAHLSIGIPAHGVLFRDELVRLTRAHISVEFASFLYSLYQSTGLEMSPWPASAHQR